MEIEPELRPIAPKERRRAARVLASAFIADPDFLSAFGQEPRLREFHLRVLFGFQLAVKLVIERPPLALVASGKMVAVLTHTDTAGFEPVNSLTSLSGLRLPAFWMRRFGHPGFHQAMTTYGDVARSLRPEEPHYSVTAVGVAPASRGRGYGRRLIQEVVSRSSSDRKSTGVCIETYSKRNVALYERLGFRLRKSAKAGEIRVSSLFLPHG